MKKIACIYLIILCSSCSNIKSVYTDSELDINDRSTNVLIEKFKAEEENKSIVIFTTWYENDTVKLTNGKNVLLNEAIETTPQLGFSEAKTVLNDESVEIHISTPKQTTIVLNSEKIKNYKFIYVSRDTFKRQKYTVEYSNILKKFM